MLANQVRSFCPPTQKFYECVCYHELYPCLNVVLDCLDTCLVIFDRNAYCVLYF